MTSRPPAPAPPVDAPPPSPAAPVAAPPTRRLVGIDVARALAIVGMISVHVAPPLVTAARAGEGGWYALPYGRASATFAFVAGLGITLGSRRGTFAENASRLAWRAAWLFPLGVFLGLLGTPVAVILQYYAVWFLLAIPFLRAPTWAVWATTVVGVLLGPTLLVWARVNDPVLEPGGETWLASSGPFLEVVGDVLLSGYYPTVSWIWLVLAGVAVARLDLGRTRVATGLAAGGAVVALCAYRLADVLRDAIDLGAYQPWFATVGHADTPLETIAVGGVAAAVVGVCLLLGEFVRPLVLPLAALGRFALTVYVGHIVVYAFARDAFYSTTVPEAATTTAWIAGVSTVVSVAWLAAFRRGPLEAMDRAGHQHLVLPVVRTLASGQRQREG